MRGARRRVRPTVNGRFSSTLGACPHVARAGSGCYSGLDTIVLKKQVVVVVMTSVIALSGLSGCTAVVIAGVGAAAGYIAHDKGYRVRNPLTKSEKAEKKDG